MTNIEKALRTLLENIEIVAPLAAILEYACETGRISYSEVVEISGDNPEDVLLLGNGWRLLLPTRFQKSGAWEDRLLLCRPGESYELPNVVRHLVRNASKTGDWDPVIAISEAFKEIDESSWQQMPEVVAEFGKQAGYYQISAAEIIQICSRFSLGGKVDVLIAELKATGIMSPKLGSLATVTRAGSPLYELNPSLFIKDGEKS
jgi:hypothetical protein